MDTIEITLEEFEAIKKAQGWSDAEAHRWLNDEFPPPEVRYPDGSKQKL